MTFRSGAPCTFDPCGVPANDRRPKMAIDGSGDFYALLGTSLVRLRTGQTAWEVLPISATFTYIVADPDVAGTLYVAGPVVRKSIDAGATWTDVLAVTGATATALAIDPVDPRIVFADTTAGTFRSKDGGGSWDVVHAGETCFTPNTIAVSAADHHVVWRLGCRGLERSSDDGTTWTFAATSLSDIRGIVADAVDAKAAVLWSPTHGLQRTTDGGATWHSFNEGLSTPDVEWAAGTRRQDVFYAGTLRAGAFSRVLQARRRVAAPR